MDIIPEKLKRNELERSMEKLKVAFDSIVYARCSKCQEEWQDSSLINGICEECIEKERYKKGKRFDNFKVTSSNKKAYTMADVFPNNDRGLYLWGGTGTGKSHLAQAVYNVLKKKTTDILYCNTPELLCEIRSSFNKLSSHTEKDLVDFYSEQDYLILDDFGAEKVSDYTIQTLYLIIDKMLRYGNNKILIISNLSLKVISNKMSDRIASRISEMCDIVYTGKNDWRLKLTK